MSLSSGPLTLVADWVKPRQQSCSMSENDILLVLRGIAAATVELLLGTLWILVPSPNRSTFLSGTWTPQKFCSVGGQPGEW